LKGRERESDKRDIKEKGRKKGRKRESMNVCVC
jgi:hypothetical protein